MAEMFTPGPWGADIHFDEVRDDHRRLIFRIETRQDGDEWMDESAEVANLRLIAAAPELYEALEYWLEHQGDECADGFRSTDEHYCWEMRAMRQARAALAKARGES